MKSIEALIQHIPKQDPRLYEALRALDKGVASLDKTVTKISSTKLTTADLPNPIDGGTF